MIIQMHITKGRIKVRIRKLLMLYRGLNYSYRECPVKYNDN